MTNSYKNVYVKDTSTIAGPYEDNGPLRKYFDKIYNKDFYFGEKSFEKAEIKLMKDAVNLLLEKTGLQDYEVNLLIAGDLLNQITASNYMARGFKIPFLGIYNACATCGEGLIIGANFVNSRQVNNCIIATSSHNMGAEKQFRNPTEYGTPKPDVSTFTVTGGASLLLTNKRTDIRIDSSTVGRVIDKGVTDVNHMGAVMAPAAADTIYRHLVNTKRSVEDYDLILTGDLGKHGKKIVIDYLKKEYNLDISSKYNDCGTLIYDTAKQPVLAGGSGPVCSALVGFGYIYKMMLKRRFKRVLLVPTGAIFSPVILFQKESIPAIAHAISLEVVE